MRTEDLLVEDEGYFGPGTDLAVALAAFFMLLIAIRTGLDQTQRGQLEIQALLADQLSVVDTLAGYYGTRRMDLDENTYGISIRQNGPATAPDITIRNDVTLQRISFGSHVLFDSDKAQLLPRGRSVLWVLGRILGQKLDRIQEIQIQGHADLLPSKAYSSNLELASHRAMNVYQTLQEFGIDPVRTIMSATSFGEYVPVHRALDPDYSTGKLWAANDDAVEQTLNRRIEILLIYRRD